MDPREARRQAFMSRQQKSKQTSEGGGLGFFRGDLQGVSFWRCDEGDHDLDIIPYLAGPNDPDRQEGQWTYVLEVYEHRDVGGIEGQAYICMMKTYGKPCPICEHRQQLIKEGADDELIKELRPSRYPRSIYNVLVYDTPKEEEKGVQVWHTSHYLMEMHLIKLAESTRRDIEAGHPPYKYFADPEEGYSVRFNRTGQGYNTRYLAHQLVPRNYSVPQETLNMAHQLDTLIYIPSYDEVYQAYWGEALEGQAPTQPTGASPRVASPRGGAPAAGAAYAPPPQAPGGRGTPPPAAGGRGAPPAPPARPAGPPAHTPPPATQAEPAYDNQGYDDGQQYDTGQYVCPGGGEFGVNAYELEHCERCEIWEPCYAENQRLLAESGAQDQGQAPPPAQPAPTTPPAAPGAGRGVPPAGPPAGGPRGGAPAGPPAGGRPGGPPGGRPGGGRGGVQGTGRGTPPAPGGGRRTVVR